MSRAHGTRVMSKVDKNGPNGCWLWTASIKAEGYGQVRRPDGRTGYAHRVVYELLVGPIPEGLELDHLCRVRACVNPEHLEPVTHEENVRRATPWIKANNFQSTKTHCPRGHEYTPENTYLKRSKDGIVRRICRSCDLTAQALYRARKRAEV